MKSEQLYEQITTRLIEALEAGASGASWRAPWHTDKASILPVNAVTRKHYTGINTFILWAEQQEKGYPTNEWATYKQWESIGAQVQRWQEVGHGTTAIRWIPTERKQTDEHGDETKKNSVFSRPFTLFNAAQVEGYNPEAVTPKSTFDTVHEADAFFNALGADVRYGGDRAYYSSAIDVIQLPQQDDFEDAVGFYATVAHEHVHWTGHETRLDRPLRNAKGSPEYAAEELIAELGAAYVCGVLGLTNEPREDHAQYLASWLELLKSDPHAIVTAASKAQKAVDWLVEHAAKREEVSV